MSFATSGLDINAWMTLPVTPALSGVLEPFRGRYEIRETESYVTIDPNSRRVSIDPMVVGGLHAPEDVALWVVGARNLLLVRSVIGSLAHDPTLMWWEAAFAFYHAAKAYSLPRRSLTTVFSPEGPLLERVISLHWDRVLEITAPPRALLLYIPEAIEDYDAWMRLGEKLLPWLKPPGGSAPLLDEFTHGTCSIDRPPKANGKRVEVPVPDVDRADVRWALASLTDVDHRQRPFMRMPNHDIVRFLLTLPEHVDQDRFSMRLGHIGRREAVRTAFGIPTPYGRVHETDTASPVKGALYLDVSGSMSPYAAAAMTLARSLPVARIFVFSEFVEEVEEGFTHVPTNYCTDYNAVGDHILANEFTDVIIVSDDTEEVREGLVEMLQCLNITYVNLREPDTAYTPHPTLSDAATTRYDFSPT